MEKEFIPYEQALALKELGFDEACLAQYKKYDVGEATLDIGFSKNEIVSKFEKLILFCSAPLYQQVFRWFREKYGLEHKILRDSYGCRYQITKVTPTSLEDIECNGQYPNTSYEEAELECLKKLIEIVKKQKL